MSTDQKQDLYRRVLTAFNAACTRAGLTQTETVILSAQFAGMAISKSPAAAHEPQLTVATGAMRDACDSALLGQGTIIVNETKGGMHQ